MSVEKKKEILKWLKEMERISTSRIMALIGSNYEYTIRYLEELEQEGKIKREEETTSTYWSIKN